MQGAYWVIFLLWCTALLWLWHSRISTSMFPASQKNTWPQTSKCRRESPRAQLRASTLALKCRQIYCDCQCTPGNQSQRRPWPPVRKLLGRVPRMRRKHLTTCIFINKIATLGNVSIWANVSVNAVAFTSKIHCFTWQPMVTDLCS